MEFHFKMLLLISMLDEALGNELKHTEVPVPYEAAQSNCTSFGITSVLIDETTDKEALANYIQKHNLNTVWLGIQRRLLPHWTWINGRKMTSNMPGGNYIARSCGGISTVDRSLRAMGCNSGGDHEGVVCEHELECLHWRTDQSFEEGGKCFTFRCGIHNWYEARDICRSYNGTIAILDTQQKIDEFVNAKTEVQSLALCGFFWIGLKKEEWYRMGSNKNKTVTKTNWGKGEPTSVGRCAVASRERLQWNVVDCDKSHTPICVSTSVSPFTESAFDPSKQKGSGTYAAFSRGALLAFSIGTSFVVILLWGGFILFLIIRSKCKYQRTRLNTKYPCSEGKEELMEQENSKFIDSNIAHFGQSTRIPDTLIYSLRDVISNYKGSIKINVIFNIEEELYLRHVTAKPFGQQNPHLTGSGIQSDDQKVPLLNITYESPVVVKDRIELDKVCYSNGCDILIIETKKDHVIELMSNYKSSTLRNTCSVIPVDQGMRCGDAIVVGTNEMNKNTHIESVDVLVSREQTNGNVIVYSHQKPPEHNAATWYIAHFVALILIIAEQKGSGAEQLLNLKQAGNLRKVLEQMMPSTGMLNSQINKQLFPGNLLQIFGDMDITILHSEKV